MKKYSQWPILAMAFLLLLILTTACGFPGMQTAVPTPQPPLTLLQNSQKKMDAVQSLALSGNYTSKTSSTDSSSTDTDTQMTLSGKMSRLPASLSVQVNATVTTLGTTFALPLAMIVLDQKGYIQNTKKNGPWYLLTGQQGQDLLGGGIGSLGTTTQDGLLSVATASDITDHGTETLNGKKLRHLTLTVIDSKEALKKAFLEATGDFKSLTPEQVDSIKLQTGTMDYWIDETSLYTYQQADHYAAQYHADGTNTITSGTPNTTKDQTMTLMYSNFDVPVGIKAPENAQPLQNVLDLVS